MMGCKLFNFNLILDELKGPLQQLFFASIFLAHTSAEISPPSSSPPQTKNPSYVPEHNAIGMDDYRTMFERCWEHKIIGYKYSF